MRSLLDVGRLLAVALLLGAGCLGDLHGFSCTDDASCGGERCIDHGCAALAADCASGYRWDDTAGDRSGQCAVFPPPDMPLDPNCNNGMIDPGETCDDGQGSPQPCPTPATCDDNEPCTLDQIIGGPCHELCAHVFIDDGKGCPVPDGGAPGTCYAHTCCYGCWTGTDCANGQADTACGGAGASCASCTATECNAGSCTTSGACAKQPVADFTQCGSGAGVCIGGSCCKGCYQKQGNTNVCVTGTANNACGSGGNPCADCTSTASTCGGGNSPHCLGCAPDCNGKACGNDGCGGSCGTCPSNKLCQGNLCVCAGTVENTDTLCSDGIDNDCNNNVDCKDAGCNLMKCASAGGAFCQSGSCKPGCRIAGAFYAPGTVNPQNPCQDCEPTKNDSAWTNLVGNACMNGAGQCHGGACCTGCWDGYACRSGTTIGRCGVGGGACKSCYSGNACVVDACNAGACSHTQAPDGTACNGSNCAGAASCSPCTTSCVSVGTCASGACSNITWQCCPTATQCDNGNGVAQCTSG